MSDQEPFWNDSEINPLCQTWTAERFLLFFCGASGRTDVYGSRRDCSWILLWTTDREQGFCPPGCNQRPLMSLLPTRSAGQKVMLVGSQVKSTENTCTFSERRKKKNGRQLLKDFLSFLFILEEWSQPCVLKRINVSALIQARYSFQKILLPITVSEKTKGFIISVQASNVLKEMPLWWISLINEVWWQNTHKYNILSEDSLHWVKASIFLPQIQPGGF